MSETVEYLLVVDTEQYSGNFERQLCAYITGIVGECGVGHEEAGVAQEDLPEKVQEWCQEHVLLKMDDNGCDRPVAIRPTPGWFNDGRGGHFRRDDPDARPSFQRGELDLEHARESRLLRPDPCHLRS